MRRPMAKDKSDYKTRDMWYTHRYLCTRCNHHTYEPETHKCDLLNAIQSISANLHPPFAAKYAKQRARTDSCAEAGDSSHRHHKA